MNKLIFGLIEFAYKVKRDFRSLSKSPNIKKMSYYKTKLINKILQFLEAFACNNYA